jgi:hypothetical protein
MSNAPISIRRKIVQSFPALAVLDESTEPEDVLYIPSVGPQAAITGSINNPGINELRDGDTIRNLIDAAGNNSELASSSRISLERLEEPQHHQAMEFSFDESSLSAPLAGGYILRIYSVLPAYQKGHTVGEYLKMAGGANCSADVLHSFVIRADGSVVSSVAVKVRVSGVMASTNCACSPAIRLSCRIKLCTPQRYATSWIGLRSSRSLHWAPPPSMFSNRNASAASISLLPGRFISRGGRGSLPWLMVPRGHRLE